MLNKLPRPSELVPIGRERSHLVWLKREAAFPVSAAVRLEALASSEFCSELATKRRPLHFGPYRVPNKVQRSSGFQPPPNAVPEEAFGVKRDVSRKGWFFVCLQGGEVVSGRVDAGRLFWADWVGGGGAVKAAGATMRRDSPRGRVRLSALRAPVVQLSPAIIR